MYQLIPQLDRACCAVGFMWHISSIDTLKTVYFAYFHSLMMYGIIFGGNSTDSKKVFIYITKENYQNHDGCQIP
jgi:hypothetical protein